MRIGILIILLFAFCTSFAQKENKTIRKGNRSYDASKYEEAEINYRKSLDENYQSFPANNNLGNALYRQEKFEEAAKQFLQSSIVDNEKINQADSYYNHGNALYQNGNLQESIDAYKNTLRLNPKDEDARYNLAYAQKQLAQQQQNQQQEGDNKNQDKNENKEEQQKKDQEKKEGDNQEEDKAQKQKGQEDDKSKKEGQQAKAEKISKEDAERILQSLKNEEVDLQKKMAKKKGKKIWIEKDW